ncbi:hypothetical protein DWU89_18455 [Parabacteroides acidifaciens]|uniref:Uncharacterized protein n=1 Tax=Parabacteroides acidifaciens TaxID=2290935 RepID=A0A3D8HAI0_9BACT|nr:hypothetical protein DWU89_18455 [Parabacteroides acidifaciens]
MVCRKLVYEDVINVFDALINISESVINIYEVVEYRFPAEQSLNALVQNFLVLDLLQIEKYTLTPCFDCFSISSEILIDFGLTLFTVLTGSADNRENVVPSPWRKVYNLIIER